MISNEDFAVIDSLDLEAIKVKLIHKKSGEGWSHERANAIELEYKRFLYLMKTFPNEHTSPLVDVDTFWHYHILDTKKYAADCQKVFGFFLHHFPYVGMRGKEDEQALVRMGRRMQQLYEETFGEDYLKRMTASSVSRSSGMSIGAAFGGRPQPTATSPIAEPAWCTKMTAEPAWCTKAIAETAWCTKELAETAWCTKELAEPAWCTKELAATAWCTKEAEGPAWCTKEAADAPRLAREASDERAPEDRVGFYLDRPRLPAA
jgi:hypothetical protein